MFTGIVESLGEIVSIREEGSNRVFSLRSDISSQLKVDQSISHNGVCLTVTELTGDKHTVAAINETLIKTTLGQWQVGNIVNLERCLKADGRLDGHIVQGHVDTTATCKKIEEDQGSWRIHFSAPSIDRKFIVPKGSITINGVSLTLVEAESDNFSVAIIPFTFEHTSFKSLEVGHLVNIELDIIGKYVERMISK